MCIQQGINWDLEGTVQFECTNNRNITIHVQRCHGLIAVVDVDVVDALGEDGADPPSLYSMCFLSIDVALTECRRVFILVECGVAPRIHGIMNQTGSLRLEKCHTVFQKIVGEFRWKSLVQM